MVADFINECKRPGTVNSLSKSLNCARPKEVAGRQGTTSGARSGSQGHLAVSSTRAFEDLSSKLRTTQVISSRDKSCIS